MLKHLTVTRMLDLSTPWVTHPRASAVFRSIPEIAPLHPKLVRIHAELSRIRPGALTPPPALARLRAEIKELDAVHDALARAVHSGLQAERAYALAASPPAQEDARRAEQATAAFFPKGLRIVSVSVLAEAGHALLARSMLARTPRLRAYLGSIPVRSHGTLLALVERWLSVAERLGELEGKLGGLEAVHATKRVTKAEMNAARGRFIRLVSLVLDNLALSDAPKQAIETIRRPLLAASRKPGTRKVGRGRGTATAAPKPSPRSSTVDAPAAAVAAAPTARGQRSARKATPKRRRAPGRTR